MQCKKENECNTVRIRGVVLTTLVSWEQGHSVGDGQ